MRNCISRGKRNSRSSTNINPFNIKIDFENVLEKRVIKMIKPRSKCDHSIASKPYEFIYPNTTGHRILDILNGKTSRHCEIKRIIMGDGQSISLVLRRLENSGFVYRRKRGLYSIKKEGRKYLSVLNKEVENR
jgi:DNA-binding transcriptional ArsR family regulator